jgi:hypothetical protein
VEMVDAAGQGEVKSEEWVYFDTVRQGACLGREFVNSRIAGQIAAQPWPTTFLTQIIYFQILTTPKKVVGQVSVG